MKFAPAILFVWAMLATVTLLVACCTTPTSPGLPDPPVTITTSPPRWEYKTLEFTPGPQERHGPEALLNSVVVLQTDEMNLLGAEGWELVTSWLEPETAYPVVGAEKIIPFVKENVRPLRAVLLFKRPRRL